MKNLFILLLLLSTTVIYSQTLYLNSNCELPSEVKIWTQSRKFVGKFIVKPNDWLPVKMPEEGWIWVEARTDYRKFGKVPTSRSSKPGKAFIFKDSPVDTKTEFNGFLMTCPCEDMKS